MLLIRISCLLLVLYKFLLRWAGIYPQVPYMHEHLVRPENKLPTPVQKSLFLTMSKRHASKTSKPRKRTKNGISTNSQVLDHTFDPTPNPREVMHIWHTNTKPGTVARRSSTRIPSPQPQRPLLGESVEQFGEGSDVAFTAPAVARPKRKYGNDGVSP